MNAATLVLIVAVAMLILNLLDIHSTWLFRKVGITEANPIFGPTFNKRPLWQAALAKVALSLVFLFCAYSVRANPAYAIILSIAGGLICAVYVNVVVSNYRAYAARRARDAR